MRDGAPYFPPPKAVPGRRIRVVARMLPCVCRARIVETSDGFGPAGVTLDHEPVADGAYVVVENKVGGQLAVPYEARLHAGWARYRAHVCPKEGSKK